MATTRKLYTGTLQVYRNGQSSSLVAEVTTADGKVFYYSPAPKQFVNLITQGNLNIVDIEFMAGELGVRPTKVKATSACR